ncbi:MAG: TIGR03885 family FMN-dependent LLM class oxidoreductase [Dehalococcoidia bacterium]
MRIGYHASHEQFAPSELLRYVQRAEAAGFQAAMCSDHLHPWLPEQGSAGHAWTWLGAALASTGLSFGTVTAPGYRYHPAVLAQAAATLGELFPGRVWVALGSGEHLNESVTGDVWPPKEERDLRLRESAEVMQRLLRGEEVTHTEVVRTYQAKLWVQPQPSPPLYAAALTETTAEAVAGWADGLIIAAATPEQASPLIDAYRRAGGTGPVLAQVVVASASTDEEAARVLHDQWRNAALDPDLLADLPTTTAFEAATREVEVDDLAKRHLASSDLRRHRELVEGFAGLDIETLYVHNVSRDQETFIDAYGDEVLPALGERERRSA